ncbi:MAG: hypothetical protein LBE91_16360 [Tannerella sp.]|jgi:YVTN family beta-propeller protein|nr:hypothetical protein [Tannerella sp.]
MNRKKFYGAALCAAMVLPLFTNCSKNDDDEQIENPTVPSEYIYVLNSGNWGNNDATLSMYNVEDEVVTGDIFETQNGYRLGDTGNDIIVYGSKIYIAMTVDNSIWITDLEAKVIQRISAEGQPRYFAAYEGKVYVSFINGNVSRIDTATLAIEASVKVGRNPEQLAAVNGKLYVANSGGQDFPNYDKTVSVVDLQSFTEIKKIDVFLNPVNMAADDQGNIFLVSNGDYSAPGVVQKINTQNDAVSELDVNGSYLTLPGGNTLYLISSEYDENFNLSLYYYSYDILQNRLLSDNFKGNTQFLAFPIQISSDKISGEIYIGTSDYINTGDVYVFDKNGNFSYSFEAGLNPIKAVKISK